MWIVDVTCTVWAWWFGPKGASWYTTDRHGLNSPIPKRLATGVSNDDTRAAACKVPWTNWVKMWGNPDDTLSHSRFMDVSKPPEKNVNNRGELIGFDPSSCGFPYSLEAFWFVATLEQGPSPPRRPEMRKQVRQLLRIDTGVPRRWHPWHRNPHRHRHPYQSRRR